MDCLIYIKLLEEDGVWLAEEECDIRVFDEETRKGLEDKIKSWNLNDLGKEIIYYHVNNRPVEKANYVFERIEVSQDGLSKVNPSSKKSEIYDVGFKS